MNHNLDSNAVDAVAGLAYQAAAPDQLTPGNVYVVPQADGSVKLVDLTTPEWTGSGPRRKVGRYDVADPDSFATYFHKHADEASEIFACRDNDSIAAILDAHGPTAARHEGHTLVLKLRRSPQFRAWAGIDGQMMSQQSFAEHIEEWRSTIREPAAAEVYELVQHFHATTKVEFRSGTVLQSGQRQLQYSENTSASGGRKGELTIPAELQLAFPVYESSNVADQIPARLRYRVNSDGTLSMGVRLSLLDEVVNTAFNAVVDTLSELVAPATPIMRS